jgi:hypothetical protein
MISSIPVPPGVEGTQFASVAGEIVDRILSLADNVGGTDEHRALNYLAMRYPGIYSATASAQQINSTLSSVDVRPSPLSGVQRVMDVILSYRNRTTDVVEKQIVRVNVGKFPSIVTRLSPFVEPFVR